MAQTQGLETLSRSGVSGTAKNEKWQNKPIQKCSMPTHIVMEVGPINPAEPSPRLADASSLHQAARGHHARGGRQLPRSSASSALSQPVRLDLHLLKGSSTEAMSDVFKAQFVALYACGLRALQEVLWKAVVGQDVFTYMSSL